MAREFAKSFYQSKAWKKCRQSYFISKHGLCERCGNPGKIVHHKIYITPENVNDPDVTLNFDNLELLCQECHNREHFEKYSPTRWGLKFDEKGNLVPDDTPPGEKTIWDDGETARRTSKKHTGDHT